jgi:hypothetical protein
VLKILANRTNGGPVGVKDSGEPDEWRASRC